MSRDGFAVVTAVILTGVIVLLIALGLYTYDVSTRTATLTARRSLNETLAMSAYRKMVQRINEDRYYVVSNQLSKETNTCLLIKVTHPTDGWSSQPDWRGNCPSISNATADDMDSVINYKDLSYTTQNGAEVYVKIVYSSSGNTSVSRGHSLNIAGTSTLSTGTQTVKPPAQPSVYKIAIVVIGNHGDKEEFEGMYLY